MGKMMGKGKMPGEQDGEHTTWTKHQVPIMYEPLTKGPPHILPRGLAKESKRIKKALKNI